MNTRQTLLLSAVTAFASGFLTGLFVAPRSGRQMRRRFTRHVQAQARRFSEQLRALEGHLQTMSQQFGDRMRETTQDALDQIVPSIPEDEAAWQIEGEELARNLRRMPRK